MSEYPDDRQVERIRTWEFHTAESFVEFMAYVRSVGKYWPQDDPFGWHECEKTRTYHVSTGGWSGNEEILGAMQENFIFWSVCWSEHHRGGHYVFTLPDPRVYFRKDVMA